MDKRRAVRIGVKGQVSGRMILVDSLEIEDLSMTGVRFKSLRRLEMNSPHRIKIVHGDVAIALKGTIVRASFKGLQQLEGGSIPLYEFGMHFEDMTDREKANIEKLINILSHE
jgi:hypothetical protein